MVDGSSKGNMIMTILTTFARVMRRSALVAVLGAAALPAHAEFMGGGVIYDPVGCAWPTGVEMTRARYRAIEADGGDLSELVLNFAVGGVNTYAVQGAYAPGRAWVRNTGRSIWGGFYPMSPRSPRIRVLERETVPYIGGAIADARDIRLRVRIREFNGQGGCSVSVALQMHRWN